MRTPEHICLLIDALVQGVSTTEGGLRRGKKGRVKCPWPVDDRDKYDVVDTCCITAWENIAAYLVREGYAQYDGRYVRIKRLLD
jgi:hypothetical protein